VLSVEGLAFLVFFRGAHSWAFSFLLLTFLSLQVFRPQSNNSWICIEMTRGVVLAAFLLLFVGHVAGDLYEVLGVSNDASTAEIKKRFRTLSRTEHPDKRPDDPNAGERFGACGLFYPRSEASSDRFV
jgi:hypothetical protein